MVTNWCFIDICGCKDKSFFRDEKHSIGTSECKNINFNSIAPTVAYKIMTDLLELMLMQRKIKT